MRVYSQKSWVSLNPSAMRACALLLTHLLAVSAFGQTNWPGALAVRQAIDLNGNRLAVDSFDSSDPTKSTNGQYDPAQYSGDNGDVMALGGILNSLNTGTAQIYGHAYTLSGSNTMAIGPGGIGGHSWLATNSGIEPGWWLQSANPSFPATSYPNTAEFLTATGGVWVSTSLSNYTTAATTTTWPGPITTSTNYNTMSGTTAPLPGTYLWVTKSGAIYTWAVSIASYNYPVSNTATVYSTNSYDYILVGATGPYTNYYTATDLSGTTYVTGSNVVLALPNGLNMSGGDTFTVGRGGNIVVYSGGTSCTIGGNGVLNQAGYAADFLLYAAPSVMSLNVSGNGGFSGVLVAPNANASINGGGSSLTHFYGSLMVNSLTLNGSVFFHYDESLSSTSFSSPWITTQPQSQNKLVGQNATFTTTVAGQQSLSFQWYFSPTSTDPGVPVPGATNSQLILTNLTLGSQGWYWVCITNPVGSAVSSSAMLHIYSSAAGILTPAFGLPDQFQLGMSGVPGFLYVLESSTNLTNWIPMATNTAPSVFILPAGEYSNEFFRSVWFPQ